LIANYRKHLYGDCRICRGPARARHSRSTPPACKPAPASGSRVSTSASTTSARFTIPKYSSPRRWRLPARFRRRCARSS
jgi:hypothetical protein